MFDTTEDLPTTFDIQERGLVIGEKTTKILDITTLDNNVRLEKQLVGLKDADKNEPVPELQPPVAIFDKLVLKNSGEARYTVKTKPVTSGGMANIYEGLDTKIGRKVAIKIMPSMFKDLDEYKYAVERDGKIMARLVYPNIVIVHDLVKAQVPGDSEERTALVMEWMAPDKFPTLGKLIKEGKAGSPKLIVRVANSVGSALDYVSAQGYVYRDTKPDNVFVGQDVIKISDFGLAIWQKSQNRDSDFWDEILIGGTPYFMSPEAVRGSYQDGRSDLFSLGSVLYAMVAGESPFVPDASVPANEKGYDAMAKVSEAVYPKLTDRESLKDENQDMLRALDNVLVKALAKDPNDRYQSGSELAEAVGAALKPFIPLQEEPNEQI